MGCVLLCVCLAGAESEANADKIITGLEPNKEEVKKVVVRASLSFSHHSGGTKERRDTAEEKSRFQGGSVPSPLV